MHPKDVETAVEEALNVTSLETKSASVGAAVVDFEDFGFTDPPTGKPKRAVITSRVGGVMVTWDGATDPTATVGHLCPQDGTIVVAGWTNIQRLQFLREASTTATVTITLEG